MIHHAGTTQAPTSRRYHASPNITVEVGAALRPQELSAFDHHLTARWQLYTTLGPVLARSNVEHEPGPCTGRRYGCLTGTWSPPPACPSPWSRGALVAGCANTDQRPATSGSA
jgi:hypothetical protein